MLFYFQECPKTCLKDFIMPSESQNRIQSIIKSDGKTFAQEAGIRLANKPQPLFQLLCASLLFSARISYTLALQAIRALWRQGWTSPEAMLNANNRERVRTINEAGYARYDERTSVMLAASAEKTLKEYQGDLRRLREKAQRKPEKEREFLKEFKGIGDVGADIFFREAQIIWPELWPFADRRALKGAREAGLPQDARSLAELVPRRNYPALLDSLVKQTLKH